MEQEEHGLAFVFVCQIYPLEFKRSYRYTLNFSSKRIEILPHLRMKHNSRFRVRDSLHNDYTCSLLHYQVLLIHEAERDGSEKNTAGSWCKRCRRQRDIMQTEKRPTKHVTALMISIGNLLSHTIRSSSFT